MWGWGGRRQDRQVSRLMALLQLAHIVFGLFISSTVFIWWDIVDTSLVWKNKINLFEKVDFMRIVLLCGPTVFQGWWPICESVTDSSCDCKTNWRRNASCWGYEMGKRENKTSLLHSAKMSLSLSHLPLIKGNIFLSRHSNENSEMKNQKGN